MEIAELESLLEIEDPSAEAWCSLFLRLKNNWDKINAHKTAGIVCDALLKKSEEIGVKDKYNIWKIIYTFSSRKHHFEFELPDSPHLMYSMNINFTTNIFSISALVELSLYDELNVKLMRLLLNNGCLHPIEFNEGINMLHNETIEFFRRDTPKLPGHVCNFVCWEEIRNRLLLLDPHHFRKWGLHQRGFRRILLATMCIPVLHYRNTNGAEYFVQSLELYFRAVADPFVQADEFEALLRFFLFDVSKDYIDGLVQDFKRLYPESQGLYRPRSLKHLCRCAIRQNLTHRLETLPVLLEDLVPLPRSLKMYIMGDL